MWGGQVQPKKDGSQSPVETLGFVAIHYRAGSQYRASQHPSGGNPEWLVLQALALPYPALPCPLSGSPSLVVSGEQPSLPPGPGALIRARGWLG